MRRIDPIDVSEWLSLAAAPTFALMAVVTGILDGGGAHQVACSGTMQVSPLGGMVPMYLLMSGFHFAPWLKLISRLTLTWSAPTQAKALTKAEN